MLQSEEYIFGCSMESKKVYCKCADCSYSEHCGNAFKFKIGAIGNHIVDHEDKKVFIRLDGKLGIFSRYDFDMTCQVLVENKDKSIEELIEILNIDKE